MVKQLFHNTFSGWTAQADLDFFKTNVPPYRIWDSGAGPAAALGTYAGMTTPQALKVAAPNFILLAYIDVSFADTLNTDGSANQFYAAAAAYNDETMFLHLMAPPNGTGDGTITAANRKINPTAVPWWGGTSPMFNPSNLNVQNLFIRNIHNVLTTGKWLWNQDPSRGGLPLGSDGYDNFQMIPTGVWLDDLGNWFANLNAQRGGATVEYGAGSDPTAWDNARLSQLQVIYSDTITIPDSTPGTGFTTKLVFSNSMRGTDGIFSAAAVYARSHGAMSEWQDTVIGQYSGGAFLDGLLNTVCPGVPAGKFLEVSDFLGRGSGGPDKNGVYWSTIDVNRRRRTIIAQGFILQSQCPGILTNITPDDDSPGKITTMFYPSWYAYDFGAPVGGMTKYWYDWVTGVRYPAYTASINPGAWAWIQQFANGLIVLTSHDNDISIMNQYVVPLPAGNWKDLTGGFVGSVSGSITLFNGDGALLVPAGSVFAESATTVDTYKFSLSAPTTITQKVADSISTTDTFKSYLQNPKAGNITYPSDPILYSLLNYVFDANNNPVNVQVEYVQATFSLPMITIGFVAERVKWLVIGGLRKRHYATYDVNVYSSTYQEKYMITDQVKKLINKNRQVYAGSGFLWMQETAARDKDDSTVRPVIYGYSLQIEVIYDEVAQ